MGDIVRRRGMAMEETSPYPFISNFPEFNEFGAFILTPVSIDGDGNNVFISSGSTNYQWAGGGELSRTIRLTIDASKIKVSYRNGSIWSAWISKAFVDFPVKFKRCTGTTASAPLVTFEVVKE